MGRLKIVDGVQLHADLTAVANAIRTKGETTEYLNFPDDFCSAIAGIELADPLRMKALDLYMTNQLEEYTSDVEGVMIAYAFRNCDRLRSITLTRVTIAGNYSFQNCTKLESINFPMIKEISTGGFSSCANLKNVYTPKILKIAASGFASCSALAYLDAYGSAEIASKAFSNCISLQALVLRCETVAQLAATDAFSGTPIAKGTGYIYVPRALLEGYQAAENWSNFAAQFRAIEDYPDIVGGGTA